MSTVELERTLEAEEALGEELQQYAGLWVAVVDAHVVASAPTLGELLEQVENREDVELIEVGTGEQVVSFY